MEEGVSLYFIDSLVPFFCVSVLFLRSAVCKEDKLYIYPPVCMEVKLDIYPAVSSLILHGIRTARCQLPPSTLAAFVLRSGRCRNAAEPSSRYPCSWHDYVSGKLLAAATRVFKRGFYPCDSSHTARLSS